MSLSRLLQPRLLICGALFSVGITQASALHAQALPGATGPLTPSHFEVYGGYGYFSPFGSTVNNVPYHGVGNLNVTASVTDYLSRNLGVQIEGQVFDGPSKRSIPYQCAPSCSARDQEFYSAEAGPILRLPVWRVIPFIHVLAGEAKVNGPFAQPLTWGIGLTLGGGVDYVLPHTRNRVSVRLQPDLLYAHVNYPKNSDPNLTGTGNLTAIKGSAGLVFRFYK